MKAGPLTGGLILLLTLVFFLAEVRQATTPQQPAIPRGGAWRAFEWWYTQRAYPNAVIPVRGFRDGHMQKELIASRKKPTHDLASMPSAWESIGPDNIGGRILSIGIHPESTNVVFAGSASGGLWKSSTGGTGPDAWTYVNTGFPALSISAIAIDNMHPDTIYLGTGEISRYERPLVGVVGARSSYGLGILKSTDGGNTWDTTGLSWSFEQVTAIQKIVINPQNSSTVFAATSEGVYRSTDAGQTWSVTNSVLMAMDILINPADTTVLISAHGNLNSSPDPGLYISFDGGSVWTKLEGGLPGVNFGRTSLSASPSDPSVVYAGISNASTSGILGLYRSTNGGLTWSLRSGTNYVGSQGWYDNIIAAHPTDPSTVYCGGLHIHKSVDGGSTLPQISAGSVHVDHHAMAFDPTDPEIVYFGTDGGMYKTTDGGITFLDLNKGLLTTQFYPGFANALDDSTIALGGLQDNGTLMYVGNDSWISRWGGDGGWCAIDPSDKLIMYAETQYGRIVRTYNGGFQFTQATLGLPSGTSNWNFIPPFVIAPSEPNILYAGSRNVYKTTNQGSLWTASNDTVTLNGTNIACIGVSWTSADTLIAATGSGTVGGNPLFEVFASTTGGSEWTNVTGALPDRYPTDIEFDPSDSRVAYLTYSGYGTPHVFRTTDAGQNWTDISANLPDIPVQAVTVDPLYPEYLYVGTDLGVFQSSNTGASWIDYNEGMVDAMILDLTVSRSNEALRASTFGNGVYQRPLPRFPTLALLTPGGGEIFIGGETETVTWSAAYVGLVRLEYSSNGGSDWSVVADSIPAPGGSYEWSIPAIQTDSGMVRVVNTDGGSPADTSWDFFSIIVNPDLVAGWNMVSVPFTMTDYRKDTLYPTSISKAFAYDGGYDIRDTLTPGEGYWLKFPAPQFTEFSGDTIISDTIGVVAGWNMIGSVSSPVGVSAIDEEPPGIITSQFFGFRMGYSAVDTITPGRGFWVKVSSGGALIMPAGGTEAGSSFFVDTDRPRITSPANSLTVTDESGFSQTLRFSSTPPSQDDQGFEIPPPGPDPVPDIRFSSNRMIERIPKTGSIAGPRKIVFRNIRDPIKLSWRIDNPEDIYILNGVDSAAVILSGRGSTVLTGRFSVATLEGVLTREESIPRSFHLSQNFPNPFNPATTIGFSIDAASHISLRVYDLTGRQVALLTEGNYPAGAYEILWDASGRASGLYLYRLETDYGSTGMKMVLLK